jgi:hypothetical protein
MENGTSGNTFVNPGRIYVGNGSQGVGLSKSASTYYNNIYPDIVGKPAINASSTSAESVSGQGIVYYSNSMYMTYNDLIKLSFKESDGSTRTCGWGGFNENSLNDTISTIYTRLTTWTTLGNISSPTTTATIFNLDSGCKFSDYAFLFIRAGHYSNWYETLMISSNSFKATNAGYKVIMNMRIGGTDAEFCMYYKSDTSLYAYATGTHAPNVNVTIYGLGKL